MKVGLGFENSGLVLPGLKVPEGCLWTLCISIELLYVWEESTVNRRLVEALQYRTSPAYAFQSSANNRSALNLYYWGFEGRGHTTEMGIGGALGKMNLTS